MGQRKGRVAKHRCARCKTYLRVDDLRAVGDEFVCKSTDVCKWRRQRAFDARQTSFTW